MGMYKGSVGSCPRVHRASFSCFPQVLLSISPLEVDWKAWDGEEFEDNGVLYLVNIEL